MIKVNICVINTNLYIFYNLIDISSSHVMGNNYLSICVDRRTRTCQFPLFIRPSVHMNSEVEETFIRSGKTMESLYLFVPPTHGLKLWNSASSAFSDILIFK